MMAESAPREIRLTDKITNTHRDQLFRLITAGFENYRVPRGLESSFRQNVGNDGQLVTALLSLEKPPPLWQVAWSFNAKDKLGLMSRLDKDSRNFLLQMINQSTQESMGDHKALDNALKTSGEVNFNNLNIDVFAITGKMIEFLQVSKLLPGFESINLPETVDLSRLDEAKVEKAVQQSLSGDITGGSQAWEHHVANDSKWFTEILSLGKHPSVVWVALMRNEADPYRLMRRLDKDQRQQLLNIMVKVAQGIWGGDRTKDYLNEGYDDHGRFHPGRLNINWFAIGGAVIEELYSQNVLPRPEKVVQLKPEEKKVSVPEFKTAASETKQRLELPEAGTHGIRFRHIIEDIAQSRDLLKIIVSEKSLDEARELIKKVGEKSSWLTGESAEQKTARLRRKALVWLIGLTTFKDQKLGAFMDSAEFTQSLKATGITTNDFRQSIRWLDILMENSAGSDIVTAGGWSHADTGQAEENITKSLQVLSVDEKADHFGLKAWILRSLNIDSAIEDTDVLALGLAMDELMKDGTALTKKHRLDELLARFK